MLINISHNFLFYYEILSNERLYLPDNTESILADVTGWSDMEDSRIPLET